MSNASVFINASTGGSNPFNQSLNTGDSPTFDDLTLTGDLAVTGSIGQVSTETLKWTGATMPALGGQALLSIDSADAISDLAVQAPPSDGAAVVPVLAGAGAGNLSNGTYHYKFTFTTQGGYTGVPGETTGSAASAAVTVVNAAANGKVTIPDLADTLSAAVNADVGGVKIYRTAANGSVYKFVGNYNDAAFTDNIADASLGATLPTTNTAVCPNPIVNNPGIFLNSPNLLVQQNMEIISFTNPNSKMAVGNTINFQLSGWNDAAGNPGKNGAAFVGYSANSTDDAQWRISGITDMRDISNVSRVVVDASGDLLLTPAVLKIDGTNGATADIVVPTVGTLHFVKGIFTGLA